MTLEEAEKVAAVCEEADGGCSCCVRSLTEILQESFPEFAWEFYEGPGVRSRITVTLRGTE